MTYTDLKNLSISGIFTFRNEIDKKVMVVHSSNMLSSIGRILQGLNEKKHPNTELIQDKDKLQFEILETHLDEPTRLLRHTHYLESYRKLGYTLYNKKLLLKYTPKIEICLDPQFPIQVVLCNKSYNKLVVGVFENMPNARNFIEKYYKSDILNIVYASNSLTKQYLKQNR